MYLDRKRETQARPTWLTWSEIPYGVWQQNAYTHAQYLQYSLGITVDRAAHPKQAVLIFVSYRLRLNLPLWVLRLWQGLCLGLGVPGQLLVNGEAVSKWCKQSGRCVHCVFTVQVRNTHHQAGIIATQLTVSSWPDSSFKLIHPNMLRLVQYDKLWL